MDDLLDSITNIQDKWCCLRDRLVCRFPDELVIDISGNTTVCEGGLSYLVATVSGGTNTYQWQQLIEGEWVDIVGETTLTYTTDILTEGVYSFRLVVTECNDNIIYSDAVVVTATENLLAVYYSQDDNEFCDGGSTIYHAEVVGCDGTPTFQWQTKVNGIWVDIPGANSIDYITPILTFDSDNYTPGSSPNGYDATLYEYNVVVTCNGCQMDGLTTDPSAYYKDVFVTPDPTVTLITYSTEICEGGIVEIYFENAIGIPSPLTYEWQELIDGVWTAIETSQNLYLEGVALGVHQYRLYITGDSGCAGTSSVVTYTVVEDPIVTISADDESISVGGEFTLSSVVTGGSPAFGGPPFIYYQWQLETSPGVWTEIFGAYDPTFNNVDYEAYLLGVGASLGYWDPIAAGTYAFRLLVAQNSGCDTYSNEITITVT